MAGTVTLLSLPRSPRQVIERVRCHLGIHRLTALHARESFDQEDAYPMNPHSLPGPGDTRRCEYCGAFWRGAYDGIQPYWRRVR